MLFDNCQGKWKLANGVWTDVSGNGYTLTPSASPPTQTTGHAARANAAASFLRSSSQYLSIASASAPNLGITGAFTISGWIKLVASNDGNYYVIVNKSPNTGATGFGLHVSNTGRIAAHIRDTNYTGTTLLTPGVWYYAMVVYDMVDVRLYVNNILDNTPPALSLAVTTNANAFAVGCWGDLVAHRMNGIIDDVVIWNRALSDVERAACFALGDDFDELGVISGTVKDKQGSVIDCSVYPVHVAVFPLVSGGNNAVASQLVTAANGAWTQNGLIPYTKYRVLFSFEGSYVPTGDTDIAGAEFIVATMP